MKVDLHIERLVLEGVDPGDRRAVGTAIERELARMIATRGVPESWRSSQSLGRLTAAPIGGARPATPATTGARIARSVYRGMKS